MTSERASRSSRRARSGVVLLLLLALPTVAAHVLAQQGDGQPAPQPPQKKPDGIEVPLAKPPQRAFDDGLPTPPPPRPVGSFPERVPTAPPAAPSAPVGTAKRPDLLPLPGAQPARPPAFRLVSGKEPASPPAAPPREQPLAAPPPLSAGAVQIPAMTLDVIPVSPGRPGPSVAYEIVLRNVGQSAAQRASVEDELPAGARLVSARPIAAMQGQRLRWEVENIPPGGEQRFRVEIMPAVGGDAASQARVTVSAARAFRARTDVGETPAQLAVSVHGPANMPLGHVASFEVRATNLGGGPLSRLVLGALLPSGLEHLFGTDIETAFDGLAPGDSRRVLLDLVATQPGQHEVQVRAEGDGGLKSMGRAAVTVTEDPVLALRWVGPPEAATETDNEYRIEVTNRSALAIRVVSLVETLPPGVDLIHSGRGSLDPARRTVSWQLGPLAPGESQAVTLRLLAQNTGPMLNRVAAQTDQGHEARLHQVLRFRVHGR